MRSVPPEIKSLFIDELSRSDPDALSALSLAWREAIPFIRDLRFKDLRVFKRPQMAALLAVVDGSPEVSATIRTIYIELGSSPAALEIPDALNLKQLTINDTSYLPSQAFSVSLRKCMHLTTLSLFHVFSKQLSDLFNIISSIPHLRTLKLFYLNIEDISKISIGIWGRRTATPRSRSPPWDGIGVETPKPVLQVVCLELEVHTASDLMLLDIISTPETPFPNLQEITIRDYVAQSEGCTRFCALLREYHSSLRVVDLGESLTDDMSAIILPPTLEHFKFTVGITTSFDLVCRALAFHNGNPRIVSVRLDSTELPSVGRWDEMLATMDLERLDLVHDYFIKYGKELVEAQFPRCMRLGMTVVSSSIV